MNTFYAILAMIMLSGVVSGCGVKYNYVVYPTAHFSSIPSQVKLIDPSDNQYFCETPCPGVWKAQEAIKHPSNMCIDNQWLAKKEGYYDKIFSYKVCPQLQEYDDYMGHEFPAALGDVNFLIELDKKPNR